MVCMAMEPLNCVGVSIPDGFPEVLVRCHGNCDLLACQEETKESESPRHDLKCHFCSRGYDKKSQVMLIPPSKDHDDIQDSGGKFGLTLGRGRLVNMLKFACRLRTQEIAL